jgi:CheY-like chemotaxis protein
MTPAQLLHQGHAEPGSEMWVGNGDAALVVDDDATFRGFVAEYLETMGADVAQAGGVREALDAFEHRHVDVVVCDYSMPGLVGTDLLAYLTARGFRGRFVLMSADLPPQAAEEAHAQGARTVSKWDLLDLV